MEAQYRAGRHAGSGHNELNGGVDLDYLTLALVTGIGRSRLATLLREFGTAERILSAPLSQLRRVAGMSVASASAIKEARPEQARKVVTQTAALGGTVLTPMDDTFPPSLREIPSAPAVLFALGRLELLRTPCVAIVGSRDHTRYGEEACRRLGESLATAGLTIVSGMARGLDAVAHRSALDVGGRTIGVLGNGLGVVYPSANRQLYEHVVSTGCLVTEYPPGDRPNAGSFPRRNRLISGLAKATIVVEARNGSGALITADCALAQGREVMAVPGPITSPLSVGTNRLLQMGAKLVSEPRDVLEEYGLDGDVPMVSLPADLSDLERRVLDVLADGTNHVDQIARQLGSAADVLPVLTSLEIRGLVRHESGMTFCPVRPTLQDVGGS